MIKLSGKVLLAEDNMINAEIAKGFLMQWGLKPCWLKIARDAYEIYNVTARHIQGYPYGYTDASHEWI